MDSCEKISNSITAAKELIENETRSLAALHKAKPVSYTHLTLPTT